MKCSRVVLLVLAMVLATAWSWAAVTGVAVVKQVAGQAELVRAGQRQPLMAGMALQAGDVLTTAADGQVGLIFHDGSVLALRDNSFLRIQAFRFEPLEEQFDFQLSLEQGGALFESGKIGTLAPEQFSFAIPQGTIGIRGTKFIVEVEP
ncbi:FecR family protein [Desulfuromonas thiophila]|jgi:hypothetical protein|uniref:FecR family protein n=1 Tax=Desulfuromonas thiophila TaxID=57664 RepID=A0A1G6XTM1_9BACT|nr:FecR domain-containing protein [Desulfuromonas thiophila]MDD3800968.1 FecR domain-containing protein [Desulfuromonas thiophila]MDY0397070.1 FecR domain-containing protein [Desulfuromonas thiophila]SDD81331.1 FecR family protein [Desulfuromonas thiophila]